jgi:hypothetical protein
MIKGKITKKIITSALAFCMIFSTSVTANAQSNNDASIKNDIKEIANDYGYEIVEIGETQNVKEVDSLEEIESYLKAFDEISNTPIEETIHISQPIQKNMLSLASTSSNTTDNHLFNWYNPFAGFDGLTLLCWNNVYMNYSYKYVSGNPRFVSVNSVDSYLSGIELTTWDQKGYTPTFSKKSTYNDTAKVKVDGCYVLGFEFKGLMIGAKRNSTWTCTLTLTK